MQTKIVLQLASHLPNIKAIEPLPDIDFNIYAGNSLVGGISWHDLEQNYTMDLFSSANRENIKEGIDKLAVLKADYKRRIGEQIIHLNELKEQYKQAQLEVLIEIFSILYYFLILCQQKIYIVLHNSVLL